MIKKSSIQSIVSLFLSIAIGMSVLFLTLVTCYGNSWLSAIKGI